VLRPSEQRFLAYKRASLGTGSLASSQAGAIRIYWNMVWPRAE
jgi:hypothetical protein